MSGEFFPRLRERAVEIHVEEHLRRRIEGGDRLRVKLGLDPTAPDLHLGHLVLFDVLRDFQDDGHTVVVIIGDYTGMIGDPSGRSETRPMLTKEQVDANAETYFEQLDLVLDRKKIEVRHNSEWLAAMTAADILRLLAKATLQQVLQREDFAARLKSGAPVGALEGTDGTQKMSKSLGNYIGINEPPEQIYGKTMSIPDTLIEKYVRLISGLDRQRQAEVLGMKPRDAKAALARQLVKRLHGEEAARRAEEDFNVKFRNRKIPEEREQWAQGATDLVSLLVATGIANSRNDARRLLEQGGVRVNGEKVGLDSPAPRTGDVVSARRRYIELK